MSDEKKGISYVLCSGHANLPEGMAAKSVYGGLGIVFKIDKHTDKILQVDATLVSPMCIDVINDIFVGYNLENGIDTAIEMFKDVHYGLGKKAMETAIRNAYNQFLAYKAQKMR